MSREEFEHQLDVVRAAAAGRVEGVFGPDSITWRVNREAAVFLGATRALALQLAHPHVAAAIVEHSRALADPIGRFHGTFRIVFTMTFGTLDQSLAVARGLYGRHAAVAGIMTRTVGPFAAGSEYRANEVSALRWVYATLVETALAAHNLMLEPLTEKEREKYYFESRLFAALFGVPADALPPDWASFSAYNEAMHRSDVLTVSPEAREIFGRILEGAGTFLRTPGWQKAITAHMLPLRLREQFGLPYDAAEREKAERALSRLRRIYSALPRSLRHVGPYQEAEARLAGGLRPSLSTRWLNRLWMGRPQMGA